MKLLKNIDSLSSEIVSLQSVLTDKKTRGIFGEVNLNYILTSPEIVKAAVAVLAQKDEKDEAIEKKNKEARAKTRKKKNEFDDDDDDLD